MVPWDKSFTLFLRKYIIKKGEESISWLILEYLVTFGCTSHLGVVFSAHLSLWYPFQQLLKLKNFEGVGFVTSCWSIIFLFVLHRNNHRDAPVYKRHVRCYNRHKHELKSWKWCFLQQYHILKSHRCFYTSVSSCCLDTPAQSLWTLGCCVSCESSTSIYEQVIVYNWAFGLRLSTLIH